MAKLTGPIDGTLEPSSPYGKSMGEEKKSNGKKKKGNDKSDHGASVSIRGRRLLRLPPQTRAKRYLKRLDVDGNTEAEPKDSDTDDAHRING